MWPRILFVVCMEFDSIFAPAEGSDSTLGLSALAQVDCSSEDSNLIGSLELQGDYVGRRLTTDVSVPGGFSFLISCVF